MMELTLKQKITKHIKKLLRSYRGIPDKKVYLEFLTGLLSIPVLLTVILLNVNNLKNEKKDTPSPTPQQQIIYVSPSAKDDNARPTPTDSPACKKGIGEFEITSPDEGDSISDNPVNLTVQYTPNGYCAVVWSYRINNGSWSGYDDKSIALYNLPRGNVSVDLRVKSIVTGEEKTITRKFVYTGASSTANDPTPVASSSAQ